MGDDAFAERCRTIAERGAKSILELYDGEYFVQIEDPEHKDKIGVGPGCYIDQVFGQTWAHWVGLGRLFDREKQLARAAGAVDRTTSCRMWARSATISSSGAGTPPRATPGC